MIYIGLFTWHYNFCRRWSAWHLQLSWYNTGTKPSATHVRLFLCISPSRPSTTGSEPGKQRGPASFFIPENAFKNIVCNMSANCLGLEVLTGRLRLWSTFWPSPHLHHRWFMSSIYECDLKRSMCVNKTRIAKVFMPSVTQLWFWNVHPHYLYLRQRWVNVLPLLNHQLCILQLIFYFICPLRCAVPLHLQGGLYVSGQLWS